MIFDLEITNSFNSNGKVNSYLYLWVYRLRVNCVCLYWIVSYRPLDSRTCAVATPWSRHGKSVKKTTTDKLSMQSQNKYKLNAFGDVCYPWHRSHDLCERGNGINNNKNKNNNQAKMAIINKWWMIQNIYLVGNKIAMTPLMMMMMIYSNTVTVNNLSIEGVAIDFFSKFFTEFLEPFLLIFTVFFLIIKFNTFIVSFQTKTKFTHKSLGSPVNMSQPTWLFLFVWFEAVHQLSRFISIPSHCLQSYRNHFDHKIRFTSFFLQINSKSTMKHFLWKSNP